MNYIYMYRETINKNREALLRKIIRYLPGEWNIFITKLINEEIDFGRKVKQENIFVDPIFFEELSDRKIIETEAWLGHPFHLILRYNHGWKYKWNNRKKLREYYEMMAKIVIYYRKFFNENKIELISSDISCRFPFIIGILVAKKMGIKFALLEGGRIPHTMTICDSELNPIFWKKLEKGDIEKAKVFFYDRYLKNNKKQEYEYVEIKNKIKLSLTNSVYSDAKRFSNKINSDSKRNKFNILEQTPLAQALEYRLSKHLRKFLVPFSIDKPDPNSRFLFFPLHYDAEAHLSWGEHFLNQFELIKKVSECLPVHTYLFVKPHPNWFYTDLPIFETLKLKKCNNVKIISRNISPLVLIKNSMGIVTINSTSGFEAIVLERPVLTFGHSLYAIKDVSQCVYDLRELHSKIEKIINHPEKSYKQEQRDLFLANYYKHLIPSFEDTEEDKIDLGSKNIASEIVKYANYLKDKKRIIST